MYTEKQAPIAPSGTDRTRAGVDKAASVVPAVAVKFVIGEGAGK